GSHLQIVQRLGSFSERALEPIPGVPAPLWAIVQRALAALPAGRFRTAREFSEALQSFLFDHRLRVGTSDISALFSRAFPERRSPLEGLASAEGEEIHLDTPRPGAAPQLRPAPRRPVAQTQAPPPVLRPGLPPAQPQAQAVPRQTSERPAMEQQTRVEAGPGGARSATPRPTRRRVGDILISRGLLTPERLELALNHQKRRGGKLGEVLVGEKLLDPEDLVRALSEQSGLPHITEQKLRSMAVPEELTRLLSRELCEKLCAVPVAMRQRELYCAMPEPRDIKVLDALKFAAGAITVHGLFATESAIRSAIRRFYPVSEESRFPGDVGDGDTTFNRERVLNFVERFTGRSVLNIDGEELEAQATRALEPLAPAPSPPAAPVAVPTPPPPAAVPPRAVTIPGNMSRARMVLVVADASEPRELAVKLLLQQGIAAAASPATTAEKALALGGYDLALVVEDAVAEPAAVAEQLRLTYPDLGVRVLPSFSAALLGEGGPLARMLAVQARLLEGALSMMGGSAALAPMLIKLARRCAARLGAGSTEELLVGTAAAALALAARMEEPSRFVLPSMAGIRSLVGGELPELSGVLTAVLTGGASVGPPKGRSALAVLSATAFVLQTQSVQPTAAEVVEALRNLQKSPRLTPAALEALATEVGAGPQANGTAPRVVVADSDAATAMTLQLRLMTEGLAIQRPRTRAEIEQALVGAHAAILESPLPDGDIHGLVRSLRAAPATAHLPLFLIAAYEDPAFVTAGLEAGADDVLVRPVNVEVLMAKLRRAIAQRQAIHRA
ncbi:MAG TPA: protein kinase, partial [Myxococcaceae bacterium]